MTPSRNAVKSSWQWELGEAVPWGTPVAGVCVCVLCAQDIFVFKEPLHAYVCVIVWRLWFSSVFQRVWTQQCKEGGNRLKSSQQW